MRYVSVLVAVLVLGLGSTALAGAPASSELDRARSALEANLRLGGGLADRPATAEEAAEAGRLASEGEAAARAAVAQQPAQAEPHRVCPTTVFLDPGGKERYRFVGYRSASEYLSEMRKYFAAEAKAPEGGEASD